MSRCPPARQRHVALAGAAGMVYTSSGANVRSTSEVIETFRATALRGCCTALRHEADSINSLLTILPCSCRLPKSPDARNTDPVLATTCSPACFEHGLRGGSTLASCRYFAAPGKLPACGLLHLETSRDCGGDRLFDGSRRQTLAIEPSIYPRCSFATDTLLGNQSRNAPGCRLALVSRSKFPTPTRPRQRPTGGNYRRTHHATPVAGMPKVVHRTPSPL